MRARAEILDDALRATDKPITDVRSHVKLTILTLEVFIDIRDEMTWLINTLRTAQGLPARKE